MLGLSPVSGAEAPEKPAASGDIMHVEYIGAFSTEDYLYERMLASGEWEKHWEEHLGESLRFTELGERKVIRLKTLDTFFDTEEYRRYLFFE